MTKVTEPAPRSEGELKGKLRTRHRSPNYPAFSLSKAVDRAKELWESFKMSPVPERAVHENWGYNAFTSQGLLWIAALKAFGLIQLEGSGKQRKVTLSETARRILFNAPEKDSLLKLAALLPAIHREIWQHYDGFIPKNDNELRTYLILEQNFNDKYVDGFIAQFRETISFTNLEAGVILPKKDDEPQDKNKAKPEGDKPMGERLITPPETTDESKQVLVKDYSIPRIGQRIAILRLEFPITDKDIQLIKEWLDLMGKTLKKQETQDKEGPA